MKVYIFCQLRCNDETEGRFVSKYNKTGCLAFVNQYPVLDPDGKNKWHINDDNDTEYDLSF